MILICKIPNAFSPPSNRSFFNAIIVIIITIIIYVGKLMNGKGKRKYEEIRFGWNEKKKLNKSVYLNGLENIDCWLTQVTFLSFFSGCTLQKYSFIGKK